MRCGARVAAPLPDGPASAELLTRRARAAVSLSPPHLPARRSSRAAWRARWTRSWPRRARSPGATRAWSACTRACPSGSTRRPTPRLPAPLTPPAPPAAPPPPRCAPHVLPFPDLSYPTLTYPMPIRPHGLAAQAASALCHARTGQRFCAVLRQAPDASRAGAAAGGAEQLVRQPVRRGARARAVRGHLLPAPPDGLSAPGQVRPRAWLL